MPKYIEATYLENLLKDEDRYGYLSVSDIYNAPTADVVPVVYGRWIRDPRQWSTSQCSVCGSPAPWKRGCSNVQCLTPHCPGCGALMDGKDEGNG